MGPTLSDAKAQDADTDSPAQSSVGRWRAADSMHVPREYAGGVRLQDGRILAVSGHPLKGKSIASAELYDPATGKWRNTGSLRQSRNGGNAASLLNDGRVLLAGGHNNSEVIRGAELFDPATGQWSDAGSLSIGRDPTATLLTDGRVLVSGGIDWYTDSGKVYALAELYDPATGKWTPTGSLNAARNNHRAVLLDDGRVLAVGGYGKRDALLASAELYDPSSGRWQPTEDLPRLRAWFSLVKLRDGRVLVAGGYTGSSSKRAYLASVVIYDPKTGNWSESRPMKDKRAGFSITLLPDGQVLIAGGVAESGLEFNTAELFDPRTDTWRAAASMNVARRNHRATLLPDGNVLVIGGSNVFGGHYLTSCEIFSF
jgi:N-acetylneuraminic acid mutarotase